MYMLLTYPLKKFEDNKRILMVLKIHVLKKFYKPQRELIIISFIIHVYQH